MKRILTILTAVLFVGLFAAPAQAVLIDFDSLADGYYDESSFSALFADLDFQNTGGGGFDVQSVSGGYPFSGKSILNNTYNTPGNSTIVAFNSVADSVSVLLGDYGSDSDKLFLRAYDSANNLIASDEGDITSSEYGLTLSINAKNIAYVEFYGEGLHHNSVYWDDFQYTLQGPAVPEPSTMLLFSTGLAGAFVRRRRRR